MIIGNWFSDFIFMQDSHVNTAADHEKEGRTDYGGGSPAFSLLQDHNEKI